MNPFDYLRQFKEVDPETERLVRKKTYGINDSQLIDIFEKGISGEFGKVYKLDPQTIISWLGKRRTENPASYLTGGLLDVNQDYFELKLSDWMQEANKCYNKFIEGTDISFFHPRVYDCMMLDGKIQLNECMKYLKEGYTDGDVISAKQKVLRDVFLSYKSKGWNRVYNV